MCRHSTLPRGEQCCTCGSDLPADSGPLCATGWQGRATWLAHSCLSGVIILWLPQPIGLVTLFKVMLSCAFEAFPSLSSETLESRQLPGEHPPPGQKEGGERGRRALLLQTSGPGRTPPNTRQRNEGQRRPWEVGTGPSQETLGSGADSLWAFEQVS